jgi:hypothetical protein
MAAFPQSSRSNIVNIANMKGSKRPILLKNSIFLQQEISWKFFGCLLRESQISCALLSCAKTGFHGFPTTPSYPEYEKALKSQMNLQPFSKSSFSTVSAKSRRSQLVGFLLSRRYQVDAAGFAQVPFVHLGDNLLHRRRHGPEIALSVAVNGAGALKRNHISMPVGAFRAGRRLCSPNRYDLVGLCHC